MIKQIIKNLYDLRLKKLSYLSERDTYVIRSLYGVLNFGKCKKPVELKNELNIANVGVIKINLFKRINRDIEKALARENFAKKKKYFMKSVGTSVALFKLNIILFNPQKENMLNIDEYLNNTPLDIINSDLNELEINIRCMEDLRNVNLEDRELQIIELWFDLKEHNYRYTLEELADIFNICKSRVNAIAKKTLQKIKTYFSIIKEEGYLNSILCLNLSTKAFQALNRAGIKNIKELLLMSDKELMSLKGLGIKNFKEIQDALDNYIKNSLEESQKEKEANITTLIKDVCDLEKRKKLLEDENKKLNRLILQAKASMETIKDEVQNGRK